MRPIATMATTVAVLVLGALAYGLGTSIGATGPTALHFLLRENVLPLDEGASGPSNHERLLYRGTLLDPKTRKPVGAELGVCINADNANQHRAVCQFVFTPSATRSLAGADQITAQMIFDDVEYSRPQLAAITGGTGRYVGATGQLASKPGPNGLTDVVFQLRR
jgi:hypothetical protein